MDDLFIVLDMLPIIIVMCLLAYIISRGAKNAKKVEKIVSFFVCLIFFTSFLVCVYSIEKGNKIAALICFMIVLSIIIILIGVALVGRYLYTNKNIKNGSIILAKLSDYSLSSIGDDNEDGTSKKMYNAVFEYYGKEKKYYISYESFELKDIKEKIGMYVEIEIENDRCKIVGTIEKREITKEEQIEIYDKVCLFEMILYASIILPVIIGIILINIACFSKAHLLIYTIILLISLFVIYIIIKKIYHIYVYYKSHKR